MFHTNNSTSLSSSCRQRRRIVAPTLAYFYCFLLFIVLLLSQEQLLVPVVHASSNHNYNNNKIRPVIDATGKSVLYDDVAASDRISNNNNNNIVTVVTSPGIPSLLLVLNKDDKKDDDDVVIMPPLFLWEDRILVCQGSTLSSTTTTTTTSNSDDDDNDDTTGMCLSICSHISNVILLEGITMGDLEMTTNNNHGGGGILNTRHARTLSYLFHSKQQQQSQQQGEDETILKKQTLVLAITTTTSDSNDVIDTETLIKDIRTLFQVVTVGSSSSKKIAFEDVYDIQIVPISSSSSLNGSKILSDVIGTMSENSGSSSLETKSWWSMISDAIRIVRDQPSSSSNTNFVMTPQMAQIMTTISTVSMQLTRTVRAKVVTWKSRISRGLLMDGFGKDAWTFRKRILTMYDTETMNGAGIASIASYRYEMRQQLQSFIDTSIQQAFMGQVSNLEKLTVKRLNTALLQTVDNNSKESAESILGRNAATMRKEALLFETVMEDIEVPELGLVKDKPIRDVATKLNNALNAFPDSPAAKLKRLQQVTKVVNKEKQPGQRSINFGLDLVAMLRPDGFGSLQGFAGYQLPGGNSLTFGIHNDADDPQVIAQFGGVRPPLLRVQPKLRVDVEM